MSPQNDALPDRVGSYLGGVFWQQWEDAFDGNPTAALSSAGYPAGKDCDAAQTLGELLKWIEGRSKIKEMAPFLEDIYDYEGSGIGLIEFLVLTKRYIEGDKMAFSQSRDSDCNCGDR
jgi:hypothetical protein